MIDIEFMRRVFRASSQRILASCEKRGWRIGKDKAGKLLWAFKPAQKRPYTLFTAHCDIAMGNKSTSPLIINGQMVSGNGKSLIGADDRAGVYICLVELDKRADAGILLTEGEETGGIGVSAFCDQTESLPDCHAIIGLDYPGNGMFTHYHAVTPDFTRFIEQQTGFLYRDGVWSDCAALSDHFLLESANLSVGYDRHHTSAERLSLAGLGLAIMAVKSWKTPDQACTFEKPIYSNFNKSLYSSGFSRLKDNLCCFCGARLDVHDSRYGYCSACEAEYTR